MLEVVGVVVVVEVVVGVVVLVEVLVEVEVEVELVLVEVVGEVSGDVVCCFRQSCWASCSIVLAPWFRLLRSVELTVAGRVRTSPESTALALAAAAQLPD